MTIVKVFRHIGIPASIPMHWVVVAACCVLFVLADVTSSPSSPTPGEDVVIPTRFGYLRGIRLPTKKGHVVEYFRGIPFAEKPERLTKSVLINPWKGVRDARRYSKMCIARSLRGNVSDFSEDCLYLNIVRPNGTTNTDRLPVVVFVHGGGFQEGLRTDEICDGFAEKFVGKGVIVVNIQYRLAMNGFLSLGCSSPVFPCNIGLWDQLTAFQFVNRTINDFGGDTTNMTLMGHSAGAMSVGLHSLSPISSKFFTKYIEMSASSWGLPRYSEGILEQSRRILERLKCNITSREQLLNCVNGYSLDEMYTAQIGTHLWPAFGDELLPDIPERLVNNTKDQKLMTGLVTLESLFFSYLYSSPETFPSIHRDTIDEYINFTIAVWYRNRSEEAFAMISDYYLTSNASEKDYSYFMRQRSKLDSNWEFDVPVHRELIHKKEYSSDIYFYYFPYFNPAEFDKNFPVKATYHCHEYPYFLGFYMDRYFEFNVDDEKVSEFLVDSYVRFINNGNPSSSNFTWPPIDSELVYTVIQPQPTTGKNYFKSDYDFWNSMAQTFSYDFITGLPVETIGNTNTGSIMHSCFILILMCIFKIV